MTKVLFKVFFALYCYWKPRLERPYGVGPQQLRESVSSLGFFLFRLTCSQQLTWQSMRSYFFKEY